MDHASLDSPAEAQMQHLDDVRQLRGQPVSCGLHVIPHHQVARQHAQHDVVWPHKVQGKARVRHRKHPGNVSIVGAQEHEAQGQGGCWGGDVQIDQITLQGHLQQL